MKKKNGVTIMLFVFIINSIVILSCAKNSSQSVSGILMKTDRDFSEMSVKEGMFRAFLFYIADDGVILRNDSYPSKGKETLQKRYEGKSDSSFILSWEPSYEMISQSGDLGYTYGIYTNTEKSDGKISKGTYLTIWKKQGDGSWKFVMDTGTQGLPETVK